MSQILNVYSLPTLVTPEEMAGGTVVVIDVLRAGTTIVHALAAGAKQVLPFLEVDDALAAAAELPSDEVILGGERNGLPIENFDLGNSPEEYTPDRVKGQTVVFTTTNGTRALDWCGKADRVLIGAFVNAAAVCRQLASVEQIHLLCAGTRGEIGDDDILLAGLLVERIQQRGDINYTLNAQAITALETWKAAFPLPQSIGAEPLEPERLAEQLRKSTGGKNLVAINCQDDILAAARVDRFSCLAELDPNSMRIRAG